MLTVIISLAAVAGTFGQNVTDTVKSMPAFVTPGYVSSRTLGEAEVDLDTWTDETARAISKARPGAYTPNPSVDRGVIRSVYKSMKANRTATGFSSESILRAIHTAWINLAIKPFDRTGKEPDISEEDLKNTASEMREVFIHTQPTGATITVDGYNYGLSDTRVFIEPQKGHLIGFKKEGYLDEEKQVVMGQEKPGPLSWSIELKTAKKR